MRRFQCMFVAAVLLALAAAELRQTASTGHRTVRATELARVAIRRLPSQNLPNAIRVHQNVISGGTPRGEAAFAELDQLGIRTIISVDGAKPAVATAAKYGLRYVHLPHGYDGISQRRLEELAKAVSDLEGPIYLHCHRGLHRSPAAAGAACVAAGLIPREQGLYMLAFAGTSPRYQGLFQAVRDAVPLPSDYLDALDVKFHEAVDVPPLAETMLAIDQTYERLQIIAAAGWHTPPEHPDLMPAHEASMLQEYFQELLRHDDVKRRPDSFLQSLGDARDAAQQLGAALRRWSPETDGGEPPPGVRQSAERIATSCRSCHQRYRDVPQREPVR